MTVHRYLMHSMKFLMGAAVFSGCSSDENSTSPDASVAVDAAVAVDAVVGVIPIRFHLDVSNDVPESIYVQLNDADGIISWLSVQRDGEKVHVVPDCPIADISRVRDITAGQSTGSIEFAWNGLPYTGCEQDAEALPGSYQATFCYSLVANLEENGGDPAAAEGAFGNISNAQCANVDFDILTATDVSFVIQGG